MTAWRASIGSQASRMAGTSWRRTSSEAKGRRRKAGDQAKEGSTFADPVVTILQEARYNYYKSVMMDIMRVLTNLTLLTMMVSAVGPIVFPSLGLTPWICSTTVEVCDFLSQEVVVTSVVAVRLLLLSGDIESNPGPSTTCGQVMKHLCCLVQQYFGKGF